MAKLICTKKELKAATFLEWDDASIGRLCKQSALKIMFPGDKEKNYPVLVSAASLVLINIAHQANAATSTIDQDGVTIKGEPIGNWQVIIKRKKC